MQATVSDLTWTSDGVRLMENVIVGAQLDQLRAWAADLESRPGTADEVLQYDETGADGVVRRCRTENFVPFHEGMRSILTGGLIPDIAAELLGEEALLYKEKLNYKQPGGSGFRPHQDATAYPNVTKTVACMVAIDDSTLENGCLEIVRDAHHQPLPADETGCIAPDIADAMTWEPIPVTAGSLLWFHCWVPHRSSANTSRGTRRAIYLTYNGVSDGNLREEYYAAKLEQLAQRPDRLSLIGHFAGASTRSEGEA
ncbi:phytanoyl-CoA dioxygenase family protein [Nocardia higoensis]|uniref:phytanoyl-CoA dioxygenase family protein n=1 Tax=Nocardia higoensis TaxID=228599 RepID=UPI000305FC41|nr:phytanoyl-CoA dioxygenase family protein [Nocardia higoensis]